MNNLMSGTTRNTSIVLGLAMIISILAMGPGLNIQSHAQSENEAADTEKMEMTSMTNTTGPSGTILSMSTPGEKTFYVFTSEVENVNEEKLKIAGDSFDIKTLVANKGDKVTVKFYNVDDVQTERHSFTIGDPYKVDIDLGFAENGNSTFTADQTGVFPFYCKYHLPVMTGQFVVLP